MQGLPEQKYLTISELAKRWNKEESYINYLIETNQLFTGDKHAAINGRKYSTFKAINPSDWDKDIEKLREKFDEEIIIVRITDNQVPYWDEVIQRARDNYPDTNISVIFMDDIIRLESSCENDEPSNIEYMSKREQQFAKIQEVITQLNFDKNNIPDKGKSAIKKLCLNSPHLFTSHGFNHAWKEGVKDNMFRMANHEKFTKK